ncbi:hypothetical protein LOTGIDRAFT_229162 [Lottia gigantea]|uniref:ubiquitinyl hydrolase 1 n=1 Tax=Lottia gigantea TaxID=225164 RepID=V3ZXZ2_LOTGI|nr:hypothetical protein LOTGIDRAFT_229162 [Lottia gigantea]ESO89287.1 hypothetical protein LOTGIDRAFT_229162 [Lottia gigantea]
MRVLEGVIITTYTMGKNKKHRLRKSKENEGGSDTSDEGAAAPVGCTHINKSVNFAAMRKVILKSNFGECVACNKDNKSSNKESSIGATAVTTETEDIIDHETTIWVCLQCGNQGCDRNSKDKHALKHYETPHSQCHCITVNLTTWACWCYTCDDDVAVENSKRIQECVEFLRKQSGLPRSDQTSSARRPLSVLNTSQPKVEPSSESTKEKSRTVIPKASSSVVCLKVKGLCNLGNTCFFNAVMQNLSQSHSLESLLVEKTDKGKCIRLPGHTIIDVESSGSSEEDEDDITNKELANIDIVPGEAGPLTQSLLSFLQDMNKTGSKSSSNNIVNPSPLFGQICKKAPRFKGFQQQDSHELLRYLLDVIRTEEIKRCQAGILKKFNVNSKTVDDETKIKVKEYGRQVKHTFIDSLFGGQLVSTVMCEECKHISQIFEPFLDLSLPVTEEKPSRPNSMIGTKKKSMDEVDDSHTKAVDGFAAKDKPTKQPSRKEKRMSKKEQRRKEKIARKGNKQEDPIENDIVKDANPEEGKGSDDGPISDGRISESADNIEKEEKEDDHENSDADIEDNLESDASKLFGGATANVSLLGQDNINPSDNITDPSLGSSNNLIALNKTNPELQNGVTVTESLQFLPIVRTDNNNDSSIDADSSSVTLVDNESSTLFTSTESSLTPSTTGSSYKTKSTDSSRSSTCDIKDTVDGNCLRRGLSESLNELHLEDSRTRLGATGNDIVQDLTKKLNYLNLDMCHYPTSTDDIPYIDAEESPEGTKPSSLPIINQEEDTPVSVDCNGLSRRNSTHKKARQALRREAEYKSMSTLSARYHSVGKECSISSCLHQFTSAELLTGSNKVTCDNCTRIKMKKLPNKDKKKSDSVCSNANKQYLIFQPPAVLTLHLKRFEQIGFASRKVNRHVDFPLLLDLAPYCSSLCQGIEPGQKKILYSLYGVVEHSGRLSGGHYTAFVKVRPNMNSVVSFINPNFTFPKEYIHRYVERSLNGPKSPDIDVSDKFVESLVPPVHTDSYLHALVPIDSYLHSLVPIDSYLHSLVHIDSYLHSLVHINSYLHSLVPIDSYLHSLVPIDS